MTAEDDALLELLRLLDARGYSFITPTPATHARVVARPGRGEARSVEDALGWSLPFAAGLLPAAISDALARAGMIVTAGALHQSRLRVSRLRGALYLHSAYPTTARDAVFFGPDSYRFADLIAAELTHRPPRVGARIVDIAAGSGVGGIVAAQACPGVAVTLSDINPHALRFARINAAAAGIDATTVQAPGLAGIAGRIDVATINPPYMIDADAGGARAYRDGGGAHGTALALDLTRSAAGRLAPAGRVILYTGSAIVAGRDPLRAALADAAAAAGCTLAYRELDPDVFGEELERADYADVDRIALVAAILTRGGA